MVTGSLGKEKRWSVEECLGPRWMLRFPSPDAMSLVVLNPSPDAADDVVGSVYRAGKLIAVLSQSSLGLAAPAARIEDGKLNWLGPGESRVTDGAVELHHLDGTPLVIRFDAARAREVETAGCSPCSYTDAEGVYHVVEHADEIPARYRGQDGRIRSKVQSGGPATRR